MGEVTATSLSDGHLVEGVDQAGALALDPGSECLWIEVQDPEENDFTVLQERFQLHSLAVKDSMSLTNSPKVDIYDDQLFVVMKAAWLERDEIMYGEINAFLSRGHIITVRHGRRGPVEARATLHRRLGLSRLRPDFILHAIMDMVVDGYSPVIQMMEEEILAIEQRALGGFLGREDVARLFQSRRDSIHFQHVLSHMSEACGRLSNLDYPCIRPEVRPYFRDVHDHLIRLDAMVRNLIDVIGAVFETSNLLEQQRQGLITRQLAAWAAILGVPATIGGILNSAHMPKLDTPYWYPIAVGLIFMICLGLFIWLKKLRRL